MPSLLFVCTGNLCRSPMATALFQARLRRLGLDASAWRVESAGTWAADGSPAARLARETLAMRGLDLSGHRARTVVPDLLAQFALILTMEPHQKEALQIEFPDLAGRIFLLSEMSGQTSAVADPIDGNLQDYLYCAQELDAWIETGWAQIVKLSQS